MLSQKGLRLEGNRFYNESSKIDSGGFESEPQQLAVYAAKKDTKIKPKQAKDMSNKSRVVVEIATTEQLSHQNMLENLLKKETYVFHGPSENSYCGGFKDFLRDLKAPIKQSIVVNGDRVTHILCADNKLSKRLLNRFEKVLRIQQKVFILGPLNDEVFQMLKFEKQKIAAVKKDQYSSPHVFLADKFLAGGGFPTGVRINLNQWFSSYEGYPYIRVPEKTTGLLVKGPNGRFDFEENLSAWFSNYSNIAWTSLPVRLSGKAGVLYNDILKVFILVYF